MATGGLRFWKDGRDAPDVMLGLFDYKEGFNLALRVNFVDGGEESEGLVFTGSEGTMEIGGNWVSVNTGSQRDGAGPDHRDLLAGDAEEASEQYEAKYPRQHPQGAPPSGFEKYVAAKGTGTNSITSQTSLLRCVHASRLWRTQCLASARQVRRCSAT